MKLNRKWMLLVALVLSVAMATTGTLAYLTDEDADVNTMTLGKVEIVQNESQRVVNEDGTYKTDTIDGQTSYVLEEFEQDKPLLPIVGDPHKTDGITLGWDDTPVRMTQIGSYGSMQVFAGKNAVDKFVTVTNTGKSDAFVRTFVAIEIGSTDGSMIRTSYHGAWDSKEIGVITIDGNNYMVTEYSYPGAQLSDGTWRHEKGILPAGDTTYPSLAQVYLGSEADNEDVEAIDGNGNGKLDILVLSQAVQADGFEVLGAEVALNAGFGEPTATDAETGKTNIALWFGGLDADDIGSPGDKNDTNNPPIFYDGYAILADGTRLEWEDLLAQGYVTVDEENVLVPSISMFNSNNVETLCVDSSVSIVEAEYSGAYSTLKTLIVPEGVDSIHYKSFYKSSVESVSFPANFTLGGKTFQQSSLKTLSLPADITLGTSEFRACEALEAVTIPEGLTTLPDEILRDCYALKTVTIPSTVTSIGYRAFYDCKDLTDVYILSESFTIGGQCFHKNASKTPITIHVVNEEMKAAVEAVSGGNAPITVVVDAN